MPSSRPPRGEYHRVALLPQPEAPAASITLPLPPVPVWGNSRAIGDEVEQLLPEVQPPAAAIPAAPLPGSALPLGPRSCTLVRGAGGFGFAVGGGAPCYVTAVEVGGSAAEVGLEAGEQLVEVGGEDVSEARLERVAARIERAGATLALVTIPPREGWGPRGLLPTALQSDAAVGVDATAPPRTHMLLSVCSVFCCACLGLFGAWHASRVGISWRAGAHERARLHSEAAYRLSTSAIACAHPSRGGLRRR